MTLRPDLAAGRRHHRLPRSFGPARPWFYTGGGEPLICAEGFHQYCDEAGLASRGVSRIQVGWEPSGKGAFVLRSYLSSWLGEVTGLDCRPVRNVPGCWLVWARGIKPELKIYLPPVLVRHVLGPDWRRRFVGSSGVVHVRLHRNSDPRGGIPCEDS